MYLVALGKSFHQIIISLPHSVPREWKSNFNMLNFINLSILQKHQFFMFFHYFEEQFNIRKNFAFIHSYNYGKKRILFKCKGVQHYICKERPCWTEIQVWKDRERGGTHICKCFAETRKQGDEWMAMNGWSAGAVESFLTCCDRDKLSITKFHLWPKVKTHTQILIHERERGGVDVLTVDSNIFSSEISMIKFFYSTKIMCNFKVSLIARI